MTRSTAWKRYNWRVVWLSLIYAAFLIAAVYGFKHAMIPAAFKYLVAVLPALPIIAIFGAMGRYLIEEQDEYVRMLMVRQTLWASAITLSLATIWGFLESFELVSHIDAYYVSVVWFGGLGLGACINRVMLGSPAAC